MPAPPPPAGSVPHKMTAKAGEGVAAEEAEPKAPAASSLALLA